MIAILIAPLADTVTFTGFLGLLLATSLGAVLTWAASHPRTRRIVAGVLVAVAVVIATIVAPSIIIDCDWLPYICCSLVMCG